MAQRRIVFESALVVILGGAVLGSTLAISQRNSDYAFFDELIEVKQLISSRYVEAPDEQALREGAIKGMVERSTYGAAKAGVLHMTRVAAVEYASAGVRINAICPGVIKTPMYDKAAIDNPEMLARVLSWVPMKRCGFAEDIAEAALFFASDKSTYVTGTVMPVDGGQTL